MVHIMPDFCPIKRIDHLEFFVGNARQAAMFYETCFGFHRTAYRGLETGSRDVGVLRARAGRYPVRADDARSAPSTRPRTSSISTAMASASSRFEVPDAAAAFHETTSRGAAAGDAARRRPRREGRAPDRRDSCLRRHAHQVRRARRLRRPVRPRLPAAAGDGVGRRRRPHGDRSHRRQRRAGRDGDSGSGSLPRRWALPSSSTSTTRPSRPSTPP